MIEASFLIMINRRTVEYEYKMISSFYDNYLKKHNYLSIKSVVVGYAQGNEVEFATIHNFHEFLLNLLITKKDNLMKNLNRCFMFSFGNNIEDKTFTKIKELIETDKLDDVKKSLRFIELCMCETDLNTAFALFAISGICLNSFYKDYVVIPVYIFEKISGITANYIIRDVFYKSVLELSLKKHDEDLKSKIIKSYEQTKEVFTRYGIEELWLFGSIIDGTYYDNSDLDVVVKMKNNSSFLDAAKFIRKFNKSNFDRKSDVLESEDFENLNKNIDKIKIL